MNKYIGENRLTYLWGKIKAFVSNAISGKVDKVSSSTDNAVVRFDGTSGDIQNSGVTINDSNHLTAAKLITNGGTSSQFVKGDGSLDSNSYLKGLDVTGLKDVESDNIKQRLFLSHMDNSLYAANSRWTVTHNAYNSSDNTLANTLDKNMFDSSYEHSGTSNRLLSGQYAELYVGTVAESQLSSRSLPFFTYGDGILLVVFYGNKYRATQITAKVYDSYSNRGWVNLTMTKGSSRIWYCNTSTSSLVNPCAIKITYSGLESGSTWAALTQVEWCRTRDTIGQTAFVSKHNFDQQMYGNLTAPKFITSGGTSSQFVKGNGTLDSNTYLTSSSLSTYAPLASPALTGTPTAPTAAAGTNTTQIATTAFVKSAIDTQIGNIETLLASI